MYYSCIIYNIYFFFCNFIARGDNADRGSAWKNATPGWPTGPSNNGFGADKGRDVANRPNSQPASQPAVGLTRRVAHNRILALAEPNNR